MSVRGAAIGCLSTSQARLPGLLWHHGGVHAQLLIFFNVVCTAVIEAICGEGSSLCLHCRWCLNRLGELPRTNRVRVCLCMRVCLICFPNDNVCLPILLRPPFVLDQQTLKSVVFDPGNVFFKVGFDPHSHMRVAGLPPSLTGIPGGKP